MADRPQSLGEKTRAQLAAVSVFSVFWLLKSTWRIHIVEPDSFRQALLSTSPMIYSHWHGDELALVYLLGKYRGAPIVSTSADGDIMAKVVGFFGAKTARGSSTRGGVGGLRQLLRLAKQNWRPSFAVDGPKGPYQKVKPGVFEISKILGAPIYPLAASADRAWVFQKSWNKSYLPKPFAKVAVVWGNPLEAVQSSQDPHDPDLALALAAAIDAAGQQAVQLVAAK
jgi:lysophospholipid acyltransferase (LPLAT)-like uncharacterized protein